MLLELAPLFVLFSGPVRFGELSSLSVVEKDISAHEVQSSDWGYSDLNKWQEEVDQKLRVLEEAAS